MRRTVTLIFSFLLAFTPLIAQTPPGEVTGLDIGSGSSLTWSPVAGADDYNVYRGRISWLAAGIGPQCHANEIAGTTFPSPADPSPGEGYFYLVTAESNLGGEGTPGTTSSGAPRPMRGRCDPVMRNHLLNRLGYGWDEWTRTRIATLGT